jgi:hypothetical protein
MLASLHSKCNTPSYNSNEQAMPLEISPERRKLPRELRLDHQKKAFATLKRIRAANGGNPKYGDVERVAKKFVDLGRGFEVNARMLMYRLGREELVLLAFQDNVPTAVFIADANITCTSSAESFQLTQPTTVTPVNNITETEFSITNQLGRPKGSTAEAKTKHLLNTNNCITLATITYNSEKKKYVSQNKRVPYGMLKKIVERIPLDHTIDENCIQLPEITK